MSLQEIAELTDRSHSAVRNLLDRRGVRRPGVRRWTHRPGAASEPQTAVGPRPATAREALLFRLVEAAAAAPDSAGWRVAAASPVRPEQCGSGTGWRSDGVDAAFGRMTRLPRQGVVSVGSLGSRARSLLGVVAGLQVLDL